MWGSVSSEGAYKQGSEMSDDDRDIDIESDDGDDVFGDRIGGSRHGSVAGASSYYSQEEKRAHHNALERKRRDHIKDSFTSLRDSVPALQGEKVASRAQILKKAADYILFMRRKENSNQQDIDDLKRQNAKLEQQISMLYKYLEKNKSFGDALVYDDDNLDLDYLGTDPDSYDGDSKSRVKEEI